uniref:MRPL21 n=1 Tax=Macrostomum lignano TaxID=282301 RepID=A0A1I8JP73_9PLAT
MASAACLSAGRGALRKSTGIPAPALVPQRSTRPDLSTWCPTGFQRSAINGQVPTVQWCRWRPGNVPRALCAL